MLSGIGGMGMHLLAWASDSSKDPRHAPSHGHLKRFVGKIRTPRADEKKIIRQRERIRERMKSHAHKAGLEFARIPNAGSYAKRTGLIRYVRGGSVVGGQDVDLPFVLTHRSGQDLELRELLELFHGWVSRSYPRSRVSRTKSSIKLELKTFKYAFDIVPMVAHPERHNREYLFKGNGTKVVTSVKGHVDFVKRRTARSKKMDGIVTFNDMLRLYKWWRYFRVAEDDLVDEVPTFLLELLCAKAFDEQQVATTYTETLYTWFHAVATIVSERREVRFDDAERQLPRSGATATRWAVRDPINPDNLVVPRQWTEAHVDHFGQWLATGAAIMERVRDCDRHDNGKGALVELARLFGPPVRNLRMLEVESPEFLHVAV